MRLFFSETQVQSNLSSSDVMIITSDIAALPSDNCTSYIAEQDGFVHISLPAGEYRMVAGEFCRIIDSSVDPLKK